MIAILAATAFNLMEYWILILLLQDVCATDLNLSRRNCLIGTAASAAGFAAVSAALGADWAYIAMFGMVLLTILLFAGKRPYALLRLIPAFLIYFVLTVTLAAMLNTVFPATEKPIEFGGYAQTLTSIVIDVLLLSLLLLLHRAVKKYRITVYFWTREILGSIALFFFTFIDGQLLALAIQNRHAPALRYTYIVLFAGAYLCAVGYYLYSVAETWRRIYRQTKIRTEMEYMKLQLGALTDAKEDQEQTRRMRHDLNKHLAVMKALGDEGRYKEVYQYAEQLSRESIQFQDKLLTGNEIADLVAGQKKKICEENGIEFTFDGFLNGLGHMSAPDICGLLANAYDNAVEACLPQSGAYIRTRVNTTRNYTVIGIVNSVERKAPVRKNSVPTAKKDKSAHGYGIEIMKQIARKYGGSCTVSCDDQEFRVKIVLLTEIHSKG